ncbi:MAG: hypothetical protein K2I08_01350 [Muribaculaceae bacterium]|nr:hypothetical protein [Muribaculaceae bacterium]
MKLKSQIKYGLRIFRCAMGVIAFSLIMAACGEEHVDIVDSSTSDSGFITIDLFNTSLASRAEDEEGLNSRNENLITSALVCLYPSTAEETDEPGFIKKVNFNANTNSSATVKLKLERKMIDILFPNKTDKAKVYVIVNLPASTEVPEKATIGDLRELTVGSYFDSRDIQPSFVMDGSNDITLEYDALNPSKSKIKGTINLIRSASKITLGVSVEDEVEDGNGTIWKSKPDDMEVYISNGVKRSAVTPSKYTLTGDDYFNISSNNARTFSFDENAEKYNYVLQSPFYTYPNSWEEDNEYMTYMTLILPWQKQDEQSYRYCYYTVPVVMDKHIDRNVAYRVNIHVGILGSFTQDSPLPLEELSYRAVEWGNAPVNVEINDYRYLVLDQTDYVLNNESTINIPFYSTHATTITDTKVTYYLYNFSAEGDERAVEITKAQNEASTATVDGETVHIYSSSIDNTINPTTSTRTLTFEHPMYQWTPYDVANQPVVLSGSLSADGTPSYPTYSLDYLLSMISYYRRTNNQPFSRYDIEITLVQSDKIGKDDEDLYTKTIKITQYPGIYINRDKNPGECSYRVRYQRNSEWRYANTTTDNANSDFGYVYVNAEYVTVGANNTQRDNVPFWNCGDFGSLKPIDSDENPNMYIINISQLSASDSQYIIGDPRLTVVNNLQTAGADALTTGNSTVASWDVGAPSMDNGVNFNNTWYNNQRHLTNYYPTNESSSTERMISPCLRIASEYSAMTVLKGREDIRKRCATYQERGYPAGRWRLPTKAELEYIVSLTTSGKLPELFNYGGNYWTAHGLYHLMTGADAGKIEPATAITGFVRPVYDEEYWTDVLPQNNTTLCSSSLYIYTYGDRAR